MMKIFVWPIAVLIAAIIALKTDAYAVDWSSLAQNVGVNKTTALGDTKIGSGIREALRVGIDKTIALTGKKDGYFLNDQIRILMPEKLKMMESLLRKVGMGFKMDEFILAMNRSAESAAPYAKEIFINSIMKMNIQDADALMKGGDTAATHYFQKTTSADLTKLYRPMVQKTMSQYAVSQQYQALTSKYQSIPFASKFPLPSIEDYTVQKSLDGLFLVLGQQEKEIRQNPQARATSLLQEVFGKKL